MNAIYKSYTDEQLIGLLNLQDKTAFAEIYERYWGVVFNHARRMTKDNELAKDILQDVFTTIYKKIGVSDFSNISFQAYLFTLVKHHVISLYRKEKTRVNYISSLKSHIDNENATEGYLAEKQIREQFEREVAALPSKMRTVFELSRKEYLSHKEIADFINISELTVKKQISNAIGILRSKLTYLTLLYFISVVLWLN
jgi:RNA polymerase sigma-70 factor, ECF subfamily